MDSKIIEQLLEKYWKCETSLEEEKQLREYFRNEVPENLKETADLFRYYEHQQQQMVNNQDFDNEVYKRIHQSRPQGKSVKLVFNFAKIAAGLLVVITATYFVRQEIRKAYPPEIVDTYSDPKLALEETKKALLMISKGINRAQHEAEKIKVFNEAENKIQGKTDEQEGEQQKKI
jgi:hypothetical protein